MPPLMMGAWDLELSGQSAACSPRSTRRRSWPSTTLPTAASGVRSCAVKGCTPPTSWSGARPPTRARSGLAPAARDRRDREIEQLRARAEKAEAELAKTRAALDLVGKAHALLETLSESADTQKRSPR